LAAENRDAVGGVAGVSFGTPYSLLVRNNNLITTDKISLVTDNPGQLG
jgi:hypothetical protein